MFWPRLIFYVFFLAVGLFLASSNEFFPTNELKNPQSGTTKKNSKLVTVPLWNGLSPLQQKILMPVAEDWDSYTTTQRRHLLALARQYPKLAPLGQKHIDQKLKHWANLSPEQRVVARKKYIQLQHMPPTEQAAARKHMQALSTVAASSSVIP